MKDAARSTLLQAGGLIALTLLLYGRAVGFDFVDFDDPFYVLSDQVVQWWSWSWIERLKTDYIGYPIPLPLAIYAVVRRLFGEAPGVFHGVNVFVHLCNVLLVWRLLVTYLRRERVALLGAALWAAHPVLVEAVCWVTALKDLLCATGMLLALWSLRRLRDGGAAAWAAALGAGALIAFGSKPVAFILGPLLGLALWLDRERYAAPRRKLLGAATAGLTLYGALHAWIAQQAHDALAGARHSALATQLPMAVAAARLHIENLLVPLNLHAGYSYVAPDALAWLLVGACAAAMLAAWVWAWRRGQGAVVVGLTWAGLAYGPYSNLLPVGRYTGDSYLYIALIGLALATSALLEQLWEEQEAGPRSVAWALPVLLCGALTLMQVGVWRDTLSLWMRVIAYEPDNGMAHGQLGLYLHHQGLYEEALAEFEHPSALARYGTTLPFPTEWPLSYIKLGRYEQAEVVLIKFFRLVEAQRAILGDDVLRTGLLAPQISAAVDVYHYMARQAWISHPQQVPGWVTAQHLK